MDETDRKLINALNGGFPVAERPFAQVAERFGLAETDVIRRLENLLADGTLSRFGPLFDAERMGGAFTLAAMAVPQERFEEVAAMVNAFPEVAHNYERTHALNMWFVVAADRSGRIAEVLDEIRSTTGLAVLDLPKEEEFFLELRLSA